MLSEYIYYQLPLNSSEFKNYVDIRKNEHKDNHDDFFKKYIKYKKKYLILKKIITTK